MKREHALLPLLTITLCLAACGGKTQPEPTEDWIPADDLPDDLDEPALAPELVPDPDDADAAEPDEVELADVDYELAEERTEEGPLDADNEDAMLPEPVVSEQARVVPGPRAELRTYRVLQWNIAGGKENNCKTAGITNAVRRYVKNKKIDFVSLNEVCPAQHRAIRKALRNLWGKAAGAKFSAYVGDGTNRIVGNSIFSRWNLKEITKRKVGEDQYGDRFLLCGQLRSRQHLRFCSAHLSPADSKATKQMQRVRKRIEAWWNNRRDTVILAGDINLQANHPGLNSVYAPGVNTKNNPGNFGRYREVDDNDPDHCKGFGQRSTPGTAGGPCHEGGKIDFIFARRNRIVEKRYGGKTLNIPTDCTGKCSDHRAVVGRYRLRVRMD